MNIFELRVYTLRDQQSLDFYKDQVYPRHLRSAAQFNITVRGIWTSPEEAAHRLYVLVSHPEGTDLAAVEQAYMQSPEFLSDVRGLDPSSIVDVTSVRLEATAASPLR